MRRWAGGPSEKARACALRAGRADSDSRMADGKNQAVAEARGGPSRWAAHGAARLAAHRGSPRRR